jgi:hypothetical protein
VFLTVTVAAGVAQAQAPGEAPPATVPAAPVPSAAALAEYRDNVIFFSEEEWAEVLVYGHGHGPAHVPMLHGHHHRHLMTGRVTIRRTVHAMRGELRENIDGPGFYDIVGRPDLAARYRSRRKLGTVGGIVVMGVGVGATAYGVMRIFDHELVDLGCDPSSPGWDACLERERAARDEADRKLHIGIGIGVAGIIVISGGYALWRKLRRDPYSEHTRRGLADRHNRLLRERLGIPELRAVSVQPVLGATGAGVALSATW